MKKRKGIILAGGTGSRLYPLTIAVSKQLLPIFDKPMVYYPLSVLMHAGIRDILLLSTPQDIDQYKRLLGDGNQWGINLSYKVQENPDGLAQAFLLAEEFLDDSPSALILGDNIFFGHDFSEILKQVNDKKIGATVFGCHVNDPERYGVVGFNKDGVVTSIIEKPNNPQSNFAVTGLYFVDESAPRRAKKLKPSNRGELEITSLLQSYLDENLLDVTKLGHGFAWLDTGTHESLLDASNFVRTLSKRQGLQVGSPDEVAYINGWINKDQLKKTAKKYKKNQYGQFLNEL